jgi:hypothetical protein
MKYKDIGAGKLFLIDNGAFTITIHELVKRYNELETDVVRLEANIKVLQDANQYLIGQVAKLSIGQGVDKLKLSIGQGVDKLHLSKSNPTIPHPRRKSDISLQPIQETPLKFEVGVRVWHKVSGWEGVITCGFDGEFVKVVIDGHKEYTRWYPRSLELIERRDK